MSRTGVEAKLPWRRVPPEVRREVAAALGSPVVRAARIWGGYSPAPTFRLALADGRRAFFKAIHAESNEISTKALGVEERVYRELGEVLGEWIATYYASIHYADWHGLVLADLGPKSVPPWTPAAARGIAHALAAFHNSTLGVALPEWIARPEQWLARESWQRVQNESENFQRIATWAGDDAAQAVAWLHALTPVVNEWLANPVLRREPYSLLHGDLRSDNLRFNRGNLYLFDWPSVTSGRAEWDFVVFAQSVTVEGGVAPEQMMTWYEEKFAVEPAAVDASLAWWLAFFARRGWREEIPGLPRVRRFQRQQLAVLAQWAARRWGLAEPQWAMELMK